MADCKLEPLSPEQVEAIHQAGVRILTETGVVFDSPRTLDIFRKHGARVDGKVVFLSEGLLEKALDSAPDTYTHRSRDGRHDVVTGHGQRRLVLSSSYGPVNILDPVEGRRPGRLSDYADLVRLSQALDIVNMVGGLPVEPSDADPARKNLQMLHLVLRHTEKAVWGFSSTPGDIAKMFRLMEMATGLDGDRLWGSPVIAAPVCPLSPLKYADIAAETIVSYAARRQPRYINSCILAGLVLAQLTGPGTPVAYVPGSTVADMRSGAYVCGSPESSLIVAAGIQLAVRRYRLPVRVMAGISDAKSVDYQAGVETMQNMLTAVMSGAHYLNNALGNMEGQMTTSLAKFVLDAETVGRIVRFMDGFSGADTDLSVDLIMSEGHSGNYLSHPSTMAGFRSRWRPGMSSWANWNQWLALEVSGIDQLADRRAREILAAAPEKVIDDSTDRDLARFVKEA
ncbi:MAG: trimethylamine methyltransferase family protein [Deltaproteobacteria bacterium]|nr:trimethylamine methyltransferase family protein [Deltaproteobacteria bacterium]